MAKTKILIIDDDQDIRDSVQAILGGRQYEVVTAADREEGMDKVESEKPDLIILDVMLMTSWQLFVTLLIRRNLHKKPIRLLSLFNCLKWVWI